MHKRVGTIAKRARSLIDKRHRMIHEYWGVDTETGMPSRTTIPRKVSKTKRPVPLAELTGMVGEIRQLMTDAREITAALYATWPPYASLDNSGLPRRLKSSPPTQQRTPRSSRK
jgi:hypothetical protein